MKFPTCLAFLIAALIAAPPAMAAPDDPATARDLQRLQTEIENLDGELAELEETDSAAARRLRRRADNLRDDATYMRNRIRRHQDEGRGGTGVTEGDVDELRQEVRRLRADIEAANPDVRRADGRIPAGTELVVRLEETLSSATANVEDRFRAAVDTPVRVDGDLVIPAGAEVRGIVRRVQPAERPQRPGRLELEFDSLFVEGQRVDMRTTVVELKDEAAADDAKRKTGIAAILGGVVGGLLKGRTGALIGVLVGGGAIVAQRGEDVELPEGTVVTVRLERAVDLR